MSKITDEAQAQTCETRVMTPLDPLREYAWRGTSCGTAKPLTRKQRKTMLNLIGRGIAAPLPSADQKCWISADMRLLATPEGSNASRVIVKPNGTRVIR